MKEKKQKKGIAKRFFGAFLVLAMVVTMLPAGTTKVKAETSATADVTWYPDDITDDNAPTVKGIQLSYNSSYITKGTGCFTFGISSYSSTIGFKDTLNRKIKKIIIYVESNTLGFEPPSIYGWTKSSDGKQFIWERAAADFVTLRDEVGGNKFFEATKVEFYFEDTRTTPTASDLTYDSSKGTVSAAEGKDLGTVTTYYKVDNTWTTTKPTTAGTYEVGVVTEGSDTYKPVGFAEEPFAGSWTYTVKASDSDKKDNAGKTAIATDKQDGNFAAGGLVSTADELKNAVLTDTDKAAIAAGKDVNIWVEMKDQSTTVSDSDKAAIIATLPTNCEVGTYLDINLWKQIEGNEASKVTETNGTVKVAFTIPESLQKSDRVYQVIRLHNGEVEALDTIVDENYALTFETNGFSTYALVYRDKASAAEKDTTTTDAGTTSPKTGDTSNVSLYLVILMLGAAGVVGLSARRKRQ